MSDIYRISGRIYPAKSGRLELIDILNEQIHAGYQPVDRASITRPVLERVVADLEHAVQLLDALQDERDRRVKADEEIDRLKAAFSEFLKCAEKNFGYLPSGLGFPIKEAMLIAHTALEERK